MEIKHLLEVLKQVRAYDKGEKYKIDCYGNQFLLEKEDIDSLLDYINYLEDRVEYLERSNDRREDTIQDLRDELAMFECDKNEE